MAIYMFYDGYLLTSDLALAIILIIFGFVTVAGNGLVCLVYVKDPLKNLRTVSNFFVVNLAVADILVGVTVEPLNASSFWKKQNREILFAYYVFAILSCVCSILNIAALMMDRHLAVSKPFKYRFIVTSRRVKLSLFIIWLYSVHFSLLPILGWRTKSFQIYLYSFGVLFPTAIMLVCYYGLLRILRKKTKALKMSSWKKESIYLKKTISRERRVSTTVLIMLMVFLFAWCPFVVVDFILVFCAWCRSGKGLRLARDITLTLGFFSSGVNPILYAWRVPNFMRGLRHVLKGTSDTVRRVKVNPAKPNGPNKRTHTSNSSVKSTKLSFASSENERDKFEEYLAEYVRSNGAEETIEKTGAFSEYMRKAYDVDVSEV